MDQVYDLPALHIVTDSVENCYTLVGEIHQRWTSIPTRWRDFIANPKSNGYQSIHTSVLTKEGVKVEIQIRTHEMHKFAEEGIAAHWRYKEGISFLEDEPRLQWFRDLIETHKENPNPKDFLSMVKGDLTIKEIYVFTPKGKVISMKKGATPIDFAYAIHSEVGEQCKMAIVNESLVPLRTQLNSGDVVEIITSRNTRPSMEWLKYVTTKRAKNNILNYFQKQEYVQHQEKGKRIWNRILREFKKKHKLQLPDKEIEERVKKVLGTDMDSFFRIIGSSRKMLDKGTLKKLFPEISMKDIEPDKKPIKKTSQLYRLVNVEGYQDIDVMFARCCNPIKGDKIAGYMTKNRGLVIHKENCINLKHVMPTRRKKVFWNKDEKDYTYIVRLDLIVAHKSGLLSSIATIIADNNSNIRKIESEKVSQNMDKLKITIEVNDRDQLISIQKKLKTLKDIYRIIRRGQSQNEKEHTLYLLEKKLRDAVSKMKFETGKKCMETIKQEDKKRGEQLSKEFELIYPPDIVSEKLTEYWSVKKREIEWWHRIWLATAECNKFEFKSREAENKSAIDSSQQKQEEQSRREESQKKATETETPMQKGNKLENAMLELLSEFFNISEKSEKNILMKLRKQGKGPQYGRDLEFDCLLKGEKEVKCYIECKNYRKITPKGEEKKIKLNVISDKLMQTELSDPDLHHWILISPFMNVSNELNEHLKYWEKTEKFPFKIQFWTPETGIEEFFGIKPDLYNAFGFGKNRNVPHPQYWNEEKKQKVIEKWQKKLEPPLRLPKGWRSYLKNPKKFVLKHEDINDFSQNYDNYIKMKCKNEGGKVKSLEDVILKWLNEPVKKEPVLMLLGEFGDGKSFFTYCFTRKLAEEFCKTQAGWIPVRFSLREFNPGRPLRATYLTPQEFLKQRIDLFGADLNGWTDISEKYNSLVILDGFDEMSTNLDNQTILENTHSLINLCKEFEGQKILITSRKHFFENKRDKSRLLGRVGTPNIYHLVSIEKNVTRNHLKEYAQKNGKIEQFNKIQNLHDPIGLAKKPLFMQMIKETLDDLPLKSKNLDEMDLYDTYTRKCLRRKIEQLEEYRLQKEQEEIVSELIKILEKVALKLQESGQEIVFLQDFKDSSETKKWVEALWAITELNESLEEDVTTRVAVRSLLKRMPGKDEKKWPVNFCHRSMKEYFVALGICRFLRDDIDKAEFFLKNCYLNYEIFYFAGKYMEKNNTPKYEKNLLKLIHLTRNKSSDSDDTQLTALGCNSVNLLYRFKRELPGNDWSQLLLDNAVLSEADLSGKNFSGTSLRYANLDNTILENADFRNSDLTGVMIEETEEIKSILVSNTLDKLYAIYEDGIIREWRINLPHIPHPKNLYQMGMKNVENLTMLEFPERYINFFKNNDFLFFQKEENKTGNKFALISEFEINPQQTILSLKEKSLLIRKKHYDNDKVLLIDIENMEIVKSNDFVPYTLYDNLGFDGFLTYNEDHGLKLIEMSFKDDNYFLVKESQDVTCITTLDCHDNTYLIGWGQKNGFIHVSILTKINRHWKYRHVLEHKSHKGMVRDIKLINGEKIVSGGTDKKLCVLEFDRNKKNKDNFLTKELQLRIRCEGMKIKGLKSKREYELLETLIEKASQ